MYSMTILQNLIVVGLEKKWAMADYEIIEFISIMRLKNVWNRRNDALSNPLLNPLITLGM